jgi:hypothetical protein
VKDGHRILGFLCRNEPELRRNSEAYSAIRTGDKAGGLRLAANHALRTFFFSALPCGAYSCLEFLLIATRLERWRTGYGAGSAGGTHANLAPKGAPQMRILLDRCLPDDQSPDGWTSRPNVSPRHTGRVIASTQIASTQIFISSASRAREPPSGPIPRVISGRTH